MDKVEVARRQLGTALHMFLHEQDPVSIHCLALGGGEIAEWLAEKAGAQPFKNHILETFPDLKIVDIRAVHRKNWNAFKHAVTRSGADRDDGAILAAFDPRDNVHMLFIGWYDYGMAGLSRPIEAQVFEAWYLAKYPEKVNPEASFAGIEYLFPELTRLPADRQHSRLLDSIRKYREDGSLMAHPDTDRRPLLMPWPAESTE
jgi:hypothetical protein